MTKRDFSSRRDLFRKGQIERFKDYKKFERKFVAKQKSERQRGLVVIIAILMVLLMILFNSFREESESYLSHPETEMKVVGGDNPLK